VRQLLQHTLTPQDRAGITENLVNTVYGLTGGNPYWCVEVGRFIKDNNVEIFMNRIAVEASGGDDSGRTAASTPEEAMMGRMGILVVCRFERLLVEEQSVMRYASVAGLEFSMDLLHTVLPRNIRPQLELLMQALVSARFVVYSRHTYYKFRNSMVHMVLYNLTPASSRQKMHKAIANYYVMGYGQDPLYLPVTTYHLLQARVEPKQAFKYVCKTAAHALVALCYDDCMEALERAVELASCTSEIHAVLFVHHYIWTMHQLGHTITRGSDLCSGQEGNVHGSSSNGINVRRGENSGNDKNHRNETVSACNSNNDARGLGGAGESCTVNDSNKNNSISENSWRMGKGDSKQRSNRGQEGSSQGDSRRRKFSFGRRRTGDENYVSAREESTGRISSHIDHTSLATAQAQTQALEVRLTKFRSLAREPHVRLCSAGQFCPTLQGTFPSPRQQAADDDLADSMRKSPAPIPAAGTRKAPAMRAEGTSKLLEEPAEKYEYVAPTGGKDEERGKANGGSHSQYEGSHDCARLDSLKALNSVSITRSRSGSSFGPEEHEGSESEHTGENFILHMGANSNISGRNPHHEGSSKLRTSLGWELAHLLHVCLGRYLEPGGPSPG
ncbi:unnamed protein product, partial [Hapterophycus canaliculatus]